MATKWEVTCEEMSSPTGQVFKVTRRIPLLSVSETKFFSTKDEAKKQVEDWLC